MSNITLEEIKNYANGEYDTDIRRMARKILEILEAKPAAFLIEFEEAVTEDYTHFYANVMLEKPEGHYGECSTELIRKPTLW